MFNKPGSIQKNNNDTDKDESNVRAQERQSKMDEMRRLYEIELDECQSEVLVYVSLCHSNHYPFHRF